MSDPIKLREALELVVERFEMAYAEPPGIDEVLAATRDYLALLESEAIVIRRDAEGNWPSELQDVIDDWAIDYVLEGSVSVRNLFDALAELFKAQA